MSRTKVVLIGAGSATFTTCLVADLIRAAGDRQWSLALVDIDGQALDVACRLTRRMLEHTGASITLEASTARCDVLTGADVVVTTIAVGGRRAWEDDIALARRHGVFQPVGDTVGPGGISRALRQIPPMIEIARDVQSLCPQALFFNYANPMSAICRAVGKSGAAPIIGLCHGVKGTIRWLCSLLDVPCDEVQAEYFGINHLTWIMRLEHNGESLWPRFAALPDDVVAQDPLCWELFHTHGAFPAVRDRHVVEFFPERFPAGEYCGKILGVSAFNIEQTIRAGQARYTEMTAIAAGDIPLPKEMFDRTFGEQEELISLVLSVFENRGEIFAMNVPNRSVPAVPEGFVVEMPCIAEAAGCRPVAVCAVPTALAAWTAEALFGVELTVEAALTGCTTQLVEALMYDRSVISLKQATVLADDILFTHGRFLPQFN